MPNNLFQLGVTLTEAERVLHARAYEEWRNRVAPRDAWVTSAEFRAYRLALRGLVNDKDPKNG